MADSPSTRGPDDHRRAGDAAPLRRAARALMIDPTDRILLIDFRVARTGWAGWILPGGGIDDGESAVDALRRELREEIGHDDIFVGPIVCHRRQYGSRIAPGHGGQHDTIFLVPTRETELAPELSVDELRAEGIHGMRWWTLDELRGSDDVIVPENLPALVERVLHYGGTLEPLVIEVTEPS